MEGRRRKGWWNEGGRKGEGEMDFGTGKWNCVRVGSWEKRREDWRVVERERGLEGGGKRRYG